MCGICGIYQKSRAPISEKLIIEMRDIMRSRGPDDAGIYIDQYCGLGHRRLSIIDLSQAGHQPMGNENGTVQMAFNGEIYNFSQLRTRLESLGHVFKSSTDCETVIHGYEEWGESVFEKLNGMFALSIWDAKKGQLILAKDRVGKKPLFYHQSGSKVVFASDIKAVIKGIEIKPEVDPEAVDAYLVHLCVPHTKTIFKGVRKVPPAHYIVFNKNAVRSQKYWELSFCEKLHIREGEYVERIFELVNLAVKDRMASDVPMGAFLSGGVDSSLITALMSELSRDRIKTFSIGFDYQPYSELEYAKKVSDRYGTEHHVFNLETDYLDIIPQLVWSYGEPFADSSAIPSYYISKVAREHVKVALVGDGGDESFGGYNRIKRAFTAHQYRKRVPRFAYSFIIPSLLRGIDSVFGETYITNRIKLYENYTKNPLRTHYKNYMGSISDRSELYSDEFNMRLNGYNAAHIYENYFDMGDCSHEVDRALFVDFNTILPDQYQVKMDIASMSNSLEVRAPLLDYRIIEFAAKIPIEIKLKNRISKYLLKKVSEKYIPKENIYRPKMGFAVPLAKWFREGLLPYLNSVILSDKARNRGYFNYEYVKYIVNEHLAGRGYHEHKLWSLLWLELWHRMFIDNELKPADSLKDLN